MKVKKKEIKLSNVPMPLCIAFILMFGFFSIFIACNFPCKVNQYQIRENLVENGEVVDAVFEKAWINEDVDAPNNWGYIVRFCYTDNENNKYLVDIKCRQDQDIDSLKGTTIRILIDGKGNCIREGTTKGNLFTDIILYVLMWLFFTGSCVPFSICFVKNISYYVYKYKLKKQKENPDYSYYFK